MPPLQICSPSPHRRGFSLVEVTLAVGITSICLLTLMALIPTGLHSVETASRQSIAVNAGSGIFADLKSSALLAANANPPVPTIVTTRYQVTLPTTAGKAVQYPLYLDDNGTPTSPAQAQLLAILTLISPSVSGGSTIGLPKPAILVHLLISWPAAANANKPGLASAIPPNPPTSYSYVPGPTDLRALIQNNVNTVELSGAVDLEQ